MSTIEHVLRIQHGSSQTLRVSDENDWYVVDEAWGGSMLLDSTIKARCDTRAQAVEERRAIEAARKAAAALGARGGASTSEAKQAASRANGRKGGRPRKAA